ncbi:MAG: FAD-dependent oxidoreductase, partial [Candidatus Omnitrophota bacterium]|nr:FAD-dependent oxidoreductase [Candidatus Omnitrophota bacterium]
IGNLERFVADWGMKQLSTVSCQLPVKKGASKVAVIGSGPSGLVCAGDLAKLRYDVTIFESLHKGGGVLTYGIPEFRLPKRIVDIEVGYVKSLGAKIEVNFLAGKTKGIDELKKDGYRAFFIGIGAGLPYFLGVDGECLNGVYSANEFLTRTNLMKAYLFPEYDTPIKAGEKVGVIGAGNVAMDSARCALRLGAKEVHIIYRRTEKEMPARIDEIKRAKEEGIKFELLTHPVRFFGDENGWVKEAELLRNELGEPDSSGRRRPVPIKGSDFKMRLDTVVCAIGQGPNPLLPHTLPDLKLDADGNIIVDDKGMTSIEGVFAGGDIVTGAATVIEAMGAGKRAARAIDGYLTR